MKKGKRNLYVGLCLLVAFALWTVLVSLVDLQPIGPRASVVGFAEVNGWFHRMTGVHMLIYTITDWLGLVPIAVALGFAILGLTQWIKRKRILQMDHSILVLGGFYIVVMGAYVLFEEIVINYRPVLITGYLEASYPSSTTLLVACVMPTAMMQLDHRIRCVWLRKCVAFAIAAFTGFMVIGRLIAGVHWLTDIVGGLLLSGGLVAIYGGLAGKDQEKRNP